MCCSNYFVVCRKTSVDMSKKNNIWNLQNRGSVFGTNNFVGSKPDAKKQFINVAVYNIVNELMSVEEGLDCECKQVDPYNAYNVCKEAYAKEVSILCKNINLLSPYEFCVQTPLGKIDVFQWKETILFC